MESGIEFARVEQRTAKTKRGVQHDRRELECSIAPLLQQINIKKASSKKSNQDLLKEYDFSRGVRGKYAERYAEESNVVVLPPDLARAFPTAESVHEALRDLLALAQKVAKPPSEQPTRSN